MVCTVEYVEYSTTDTLLCKQTTIVNNILYIHTYYSLVPWSMYCIVLYCIVSWRGDSKNNAPPPLSSPVLRLRPHVPAAAAT